MKLNLTTTTTPITATLSPPNPYYSDPNLTRIIAFTTPQHYSTRLQLLIHNHNWTPLWSPTITVGPTTITHATLLHHLRHLSDYSAIAFTSRAAISAVTSALPTTPPVSELVVAALGSDAELLTHDFISKLSLDPSRVKIVVPSPSTPTALVHSLGPGLGRKILCPVPLVSDLAEPPVVPDFLTGLERAGWVAVRLNAYETRWAGAECVKEVLENGRVIDGLVFTSSAEVEGFLKGLEVYGLSWEGARKRWPRLVVAAHGPVTAAGAERLGVKVDVVSSKFSSFDGVIQALDHVFTFGPTSC